MTLGVGCDKVDSVGLDAYTGGYDVRGRHLEVMVRVKAGRVSRAEARLWSEC